MVIPAPPRPHSLTLLDTTNVGETKWQHRQDIGPIYTDMLFQDPKVQILPHSFHRSGLMGSQRRIGDVLARRKSNTARLTAADARIVAVAEADIDSAERIAGTHIAVPAAAAAAVAVDLEPHNIEPAESVG